MLKFRNISPDALHVGAVDGPLLEHGQLHSSDGELAEETDEAYYVKVGERVVGYGEPDEDGKAEPIIEPDLRAWAKSVWKLASKPKSNDKDSGSDLA